MLGSSLASSSCPLSRLQQHGDFVAHVWGLLWEPGAFQAVYAPRNDRTLSTKQMLVSAPVLAAQRKAEAELACSA